MKFFPVRTIAVGAFSLAGLTGCYEIAKLPACSRDEPCESGYTCGADGVCQAVGAEADSTVPAGDGATRTDSSGSIGAADASRAPGDAAGSDDASGDAQRVIADAEPAPGDGPRVPEGDAQRAADGAPDVRATADAGPGVDLGRVVDVAPVAGDASPGDASQVAGDATVADMGDAALGDAEIPNDAEPVDAAAPDLGEPCVEADPCATGLAAPCAAGHWLCGGAIPVCAPPTDGIETCNNDTLDNDCDGVIDNVAGLGDACATGIGSCAADGFNLCDFIGEQLECGAVEGAPVAEICNALDDDCDETSDEDVPPGGGCDTGAFGVCAAGLLTCANGLQTTCTPVTAPTAEVCNGLDDNCDDTVDNLLAPPSLVAHCGECGHACDLPNAVEACRGGECAVDRCTGGFIDNNLVPEDGCELRCRPSVPPDEVCNGRDDDCDGAIDPGETCVGVFNFCARRAGAGDVLCEDFPARALDVWAVGTLIGDGLGEPGPLPIALQRHYLASEGDPLPAGHTRRTTHPVGGAFSISFRVFPGSEGEVAAGLFDGLRAGHALRVSFEADPPTAALVAYPRGNTLGSVPLPAPLPADGVRVEVVREAGGDWSIRVEGLVLPAVPYARGAAGGTFDRVSLSALGVGVGATPPAFGELVIAEDADSDGLYPPIDLCPSVADPDQSDPDGDGHSLPCDDDDGDGIENGPDNCQLAPNVDQADTDADGFGDACDVDGKQISVMMATSVRPYVWRVDPVTGLRGRGLILPEGATQAVLGPDNSRVMAVLGTEVRIYGPPNLDRLVGANATRPQWLADGNVMYTAADGSAVFTNLPNGAAEAHVVDAPAGGRIVGYASVDGRRVAMVRAAAGNLDVEVSLWLLDGQGALAQSGDWLPLPAQAAGLPWLQPHDTLARFAYASLAGEFPGTGELDGVRATLQMYSAIPSSAVSYLAGDTTRIVSLERPAEGTRIALYKGGRLELALTRYFDFVVGDAVSIVTPAAPLAWSDADGDAIENTSDVCAGRDDHESLTPALTLQAAASYAPSIDWSGTVFGVGWGRGGGGNPKLDWSMVDASGRHATPPAVLFETQAVGLSRVRWSGSVFGIGVSYYFNFAGSEAGYTFVRRSEENLPLGTQSLNGGGGGPDFYPVSMAARDGLLYLHRDGGDLVRFDADGNSTVVPTGVPFNGRNRDLASGPGGFALIANWNPAYVYFIGTDGAAFHPALALDGGLDLRDTSPSITSNGLEWGVLYPVNGNASLIFRRISAAGQLASPPLQVASGGSLIGVPRVVWAGNQWAAVWSQVRNGVRQALYARIAADGLSHSDPVPLPRNRADPGWADLAFTGTGYGVVWDTSAGSILFTSGPLQCR